MWGRQRKQLRQRQNWEADLTWFRVRYCDDTRVSKALTLLSSVDAASRVALRFVPASQTTLAMFFVGIESYFCPLLEKMALHFEFMLTLQESADFSLVPLATVRQLNWQSAFDAHLLNGCLFASNSTDGGRQMLFPQLTDHDALSCGLQLPSRPQAGLSRTPSWPSTQLPAHLLNSAKGFRWPLGYAADGQLLSVEGKVGVFGRNDAVARWLVNQVLTTIKSDPSNLIVIDGRGDLVPQLKRKATITRLLDKGIRYIDFDSNALPTGFNPLARVDGESKGDRLKRWQAWFASMNVHSDCNHLLAAAYEDGVDNLPTLRHWLNNHQHQIQQVPVASLASVLNRLLTDVRLREWFEYPQTNDAMFPHGTFLFCCQAATTTRQYILQSVLLAALANPQHRIVLHGFPFTNAVDFQALNDAVVSNYSTVDYALTVLVKQEDVDEILNDHPAIEQDKYLQENIWLLREGEAVAIQGVDAFFHKLECGEQRAEWMIYYLPTGVASV